MNALSLIHISMKKCSAEKIDKNTRESMFAEINNSVQEKLAEQFPEQEVAIGEILYTIEKETMRSLIAKDKIRIDGRTTTEIRPITCEVGVLARTHGSALFTRGQTQILNALTMGMISQEQILDGIAPETSKRYMHHYNFPPYSVGETRPVRSPGRREIGHGALAERALLPVIPDEETFPYALRLVSEAIESNGSTSMGSVCAVSYTHLDVYKRQRQEMLYMLKALPLTIKGPRPIEEAIVTSGGVQVKEINPKTMGSNLLEGLYFAGEVIDIDGYTGGYNLQAAWSSGYVAGSSLLEG